MPSFEKKAIFRQVNYIKNKLKNVKEDTDCVITLLQNCLLVFDQRIVECIESDDGGFSALYRKLNNDIEDFQEKLFYIQASVELPSADKQVLKSTSPKSTTVQQDEDVLPQIPSPPQCLDGSLKISSSSITSHNVNESCSVDPNTEVKLVYSSKSTSYASLNEVESTPCDISKSSTVFPLTKNNSLPNSTSKADQNTLVKSELLHQLIDSVTPTESLSHSSFYRSLSSNISDLCYQSAASEPQNFESNVSDISSIQSDESQCNLNKSHAKKVISPLQITLPLTTTATLAHIENPGNFWLQLDDMKTNNPCYPKEKFLHSSVPYCIKEGDFFLAPSKSTPFYLRVKALSDSQNDESVKVLFVDNGSVSIIHIKELRVLPAEADNTPMQAVNCFLAEIFAKNNIWCYAAIRKLKEFSDNLVKVHIKTFDGDKYGVNLIATVSMFGDDFSFDIGESLCNDGFAIENVPSEVVEDSTSLPALCDNVETSLNQISNQLSCDSGVSVTSNRQSSPRSQAKHYDSGVINSVDDSSQIVINENDKSHGAKEASPNHQTGKSLGDLISFVSIEELDSEANGSFEEQFNPFRISYIKCLKICTCDCPLHLIIPLPSITFVAEDMVLVMLSHIMNPSEFYINMAMESSISLDELLENMNIVYNNPSSQEAFSILLDDLKEGMFCAAYFEDHNWYRVKVLSKHLKFDQSPNVFVQYVDYGNKAWIKNTDLRTLTSEFSKLPSFSVKCSLAGVVPVQSSDQCNNDELVWDEKAIEVFKNMIGFENCLTAQICDRRTILNDDPLQVLLWDTQGKQDILVNQIFVDTGLAEFNYPTLQKLLDNQVKKQNDLEVLNHWDPMKDEYNDVQNSYGVNVDDFQVAVNGYKHNDEEYICKYFSLRGYCPRVNCRFDHVTLGEGGVTRDREELYSLNSCPPLPIRNTWVLLQVCAVVSPCHFYVQLPFGNLTVDELDSQIHKGVPRENLQNQEVPALFQALNDSYNDKPFDEKTTIALSYGSIVVAKRQHDQTWHRARIVDVHDVTGPAKVFFVDFGNEEWIERRNIYQIQPEFLHTPFQAVECSLYDVEPLGFEKGEKWSTHALSYFKSLVSETIMLAYVADVCNDVLQISLRRTTESDHRTIKDHLIRGGFAQDKTIAVKKKQQTKYVPG